MQVDMSDQEAQQFATWLREKGNGYLQRADWLSGRGRSTNGGTGRHQEQPGDGGNEVTQEQFEASVMQRSGRIYDLARRLGVAETVINDFLSHPNARVSVQQRGWIKAKS